MFSLIFFFSLSLLSFFFISFSLYKRLRTTGLQQEQQQQQTQDANQPDPSVLQQSLSKIVDKTHHQTCEKNQTRLTHSLLLEILPPDSPKWASLFGGDGCGGPDSDRSGAADDGSIDSGGSGLGGDQRGKKKKKRAKKKRLNSQGEESGGERGGNVSGLDSGSRVKQELVCLYPFTSSSSATQRKIKQQYDQLVKCHESKGLTLAQVGQFANCLIEARNDLQHKSEVIQRKFTITKALLFKADRSSFDRLRQQIYKLELEQKRLEEDAFVYNWLQQQLKLSPAYKKMLEIGACMELKAKSDELMESTDSEFTDISFEELLAQEKKDSFWQKNGKPRSCSS
uniref:AT1G17665-like protein n=1 Tax=Hypseocharis bilobata TaxID=253189 RepID=A0A0G4AMG3_9ROSI|nr:AT1G17665-like protein [Hypseocharis bilobata]